MKKLIWYLLCLCTYTAQGQNITAAEYFIDIDPGNGNGIALSVGTNGSTVNFVAAVPATSLSTGFHFVAIRTKDADGKWGLFEARGFYISTATNNSVNIAAAEYFIDTDPGNGNGTSLNVGTAGTAVNFVAAVPASSLSAGFHFVAIRTKDADGKWAMFENRGFYISGQTTNVADFVAAEYFFNTDPGVGNGTAVAIPLPISTYTDSLVLPLGSLPVGNHRIVIRVKNADGQWSLLENRLFNICTRYGPISKMNFQIENNQVFFTNLSSDNDTTLWKFGDATTDTVLDPIKTYAVAGNYNLQLISKNICANDTLTALIRINGIHRINAAKAGNNGVATVIFDGNGFTAATPLKLERGTTIILPSDKRFISTNRVIGYFNLTGADTGTYHVVANLGGGPLDTLKNGFLITTARIPSVSIVKGGRNPARFGFMYRQFNLQNTGNEDAIMTPFATLIGYKPGIVNPQLSFIQPIADLTNKGIFQNTYQYLGSNGISNDVMSTNDLDTSRKKQLIAIYRLKVPAQSYIPNYVRINNTYGLLQYGNGALVHPPLFKSEIVLNDISSPFKDCMNSFLKKAVRNNLTVTLNDAAWTTCFNTAFDTLAKTIRDMTRDISLQEQSVPMKAVFSTLLVQMAQCGSSGMPAIINTDNFQKIIKDVTYNWLFLENLDSIGRPCFDTTETIVFRQLALGKMENKDEQVAGQNIVNNDCPGAEIFPELAELCEPFLKTCASNDNLGKADELIFLQFGKKIFSKLTGALDNFCKVNSGSAFCEKLCEQTSVDPNVKFGPGNNGNLKHVNFLTNYGYTIFFENLATATAPAAYVEVTDTLDKTKMDIATFQISGFGWGDSVVLTDANRGDYSLLQDLRPLHPNKLRIDIRIDTATGIMKWKFFTLDTATLQLTEDPAQGFLPPNTDGKQGVGFISFSIKPKAGVTSGTVINNNAAIVFDQNAAILTPVWQHIVDTTKQQSNVAALHSVINTTGFVVNWSGNDAHSGIDKYAVYVSVNDSIFKRWKKFTNAVSDTFHGQFTKTYKFFSVASDSAGNYEDAPPDAYANPDAITTLEIALPLNLLSFIARKTTDQKKVDLVWTTANEQNVSHFELQRSDDGINYVVIANIPAQNKPVGATYTWQDVNPLPKVNYYRLRMVDLDAFSKLSPICIIRFEDKDEILVFPTVTSDMVFVQSFKSLTAELFNASGIKLQTLAVNRNASFDMRKYPSGIYYVRLASENKTYKIVKW
ncbi:MAG: T9SS type A sorting domain-containing protein [Chitinophagaceae bacterium]|nr:T9SS type A sorting domain-containing protein [Chitinophagaceae bacterium]